MLQFVCIYLVRKNIEHMVLHYYCYHLLGLIAADCLHGLETFFSMCHMCMCSVLWLGAFAGWRYRNNQADVLNL
jgi:hypothetical protein